MFEFGRDLRKLFEKARESEDLGWLELVGADLVQMEARRESVDAGRVSCARPFDGWMRASALWREHARRTGCAASLDHAAAAASDAARQTASPDQTAAAAIESAGLHVDFVPQRYSQEGMLHDLPTRVLRGRRAIILSAEGSRNVLEAGLHRRGMQVRKVPIYRTVVPRALLPRIATVFERPFDAVTVTSASCVEHLAQALMAAKTTQRIDQLRFASIGPVTSSAVRAHGGRVIVEAKTSTIEGLVTALVRHFNV